MNQRYSVQPGVERISWHVRLAINRHSSFVGSERAGNDVHQRTFAGAVFSDESMHFAFSEIEIDTVESDSWTEAFGDG